MLTPSDTTCRHFIGDESMRRSSSDQHATQPRRHRARAGMAVGLAALSVLATSCSSADDGAATRSADEAASTTSEAPDPPTTSLTLPMPTPSLTTASTPAETTQATTMPVDHARAELLDGILQEHLAAGDFVGARIVFRDSDGTVTETTAGTTTTDPGSPPVDPDVAWNIGSLTKTFVAVVVLQLAEEGRIDLDAGIETYLPDLPGASQITPRELLQHTSGLAEYLNDPALQSDPQRVWTPAELIDIAENGGRVGEPGGGYHYSNTNYIVLGEIIEQVTGHSSADEVDARIVGPLGLTHTNEMIDERPTGYQVVDGTFVDTSATLDASTAGAAGGLLSTNRDLLLFARAIADGSLLSAESTREMLTFVPGDDYSEFGIQHGYGLGIEEYVSDDVTIIGHMGTGNAESAFFGYDPDHGTTVAVSTNTAIAGPQAIMALEALTAAS